MKIVLIGYGKMGREIELHATQRGDEISAVCNSKSPLSTMARLSDVDVAIDFSRGDLVLEHSRLCAKAGVPIVIGTTGWSEKLDELRTIINRESASCVYGANFSLGVHMFFQIVRRAGELFDALPQYDLSIHEVHHNKKLDSPSGTANVLGQILTTTVRRKEHAVLFDGSQKSPSDLVISAQRVGSVPGTHSVLFDSLADSIELTHRARNRSGFALGALEAARWILTRKGFYSVEQFSESLLTGE